jgi:hypothetical protein
MIGYGWGNVCYIVNFPQGEYLLVKYPREHSGGRFAMRKVYYTTPDSIKCTRKTKYQ